MNAKSTHVKMVANVLMKDLVISVSARLDLVDKIVKMVSPSCTTLDRSFYIVSQFLNSFLFCYLLLHCIHYIHVLDLSLFVICLL